MEIQLDIALYFILGCMAVMSIVLALGLFLGVLLDWKEAKKAGRI